MAPDVVVPFEVERLLRWTKDGKVIDPDVISQVNEIGAVNGGLF
jgi:hypothetical protein